MYRAGLVTAATSLVTAASTAFLPQDLWIRTLLENNLDWFYALGSAGLGLSLFLIHIYVTEIKRTLQALWVLGVVGSFAAYTFLALPADKTLVQYVVDNPSAVWFVGPVFASLTGLVFKEGKNFLCQQNFILCDWKHKIYVLVCPLGLCYGKLEAGILTFVIPTLLLGHLVSVKTFICFHWNPIKDLLFYACVRDLLKTKLMDK